MSAIISPCSLYRYRLERESEGTGATAVIMVNPSTADATENDATIRKLIGFGNRNRWGRIVVGNLFAYRATDVRELAKTPDPVGPENDDHLLDILSGANQTIFAWGPLSKQPKHLRDRWKKVWELAGGHAWSIGLTAKCGHPKHPLMLSYDSPIIPWNPAP